jgi:hypothetical protein
LTNKNKHRYIDTEMPLHVFYTPMAAASYVSLWDKIVSKVVSAYFEFEAFK